MLFVRLVTFYGILWCTFFLYSCLGRGFDVSSVLTFNGFREVSV